MTDDDRAWFAPKRYGYGTGLPIAWQGWALLGGFLALPFVVGLTLKQHPVVGITILLAATLWFVIVVKRRTRGGWRWRWGD